MNKLRLLGAICAWVIPFLFGNITHAALVTYTDEVLSMQFIYLEEKAWNWNLLVSYFSSYF